MNANEIVAGLGDGFRLNGNRVVRVSDGRSVRIGNVPGAFAYADERPDGSQPAFPRPSQRFNPDDTADGVRAVRESFANVPRN